MRHYSRMNLFVRKILDVIMPPRCVGCGEKGGFICEKCFGKIDFLDVQECPFCRRKSPLGEFCSEDTKIGTVISANKTPSCRRKLFGEECFIDRLIVCAKYNKKGVLKKIIEQFKYKFSGELAEFLSQIMTIHLTGLYKKLAHKSVFSFIIAVPLHKKRLKYRGYNQSDLLAFGIKKHLCRSGFPETRVIKPLKRVLLTSPQAHLKRTERLKNLNGAFKIIKKTENVLWGKNVILVDDICTTGATLNECAKALKNVGVSEITAIVLARGEGR